MHYMRRRDAHKQLARTSLSTHTMCTIMSGHTVPFKNISPVWGTDCVLDLSEISPKMQRCCENVYDGLENVFYG